MDLRKIKILYNHKLKGIIKVKNNQKKWINKKCKFKLNNLHK